jgi:hypothetical protein
MKWYTDRPEEIREMEARFAKKYQETFKDEN